MAYQQRRLRLGRTLSIDPRSRTAAYAFLRDGQLCDCRIRNVGGDKHSKGVKKVLIPYLVSLLDSCSPHALLVPETRAIGTRARSSTSRLIIRRLTREASQRGIAVHVVSKKDIKTWLAPSDGGRARNADQVNLEVLKEYPELTSLLPTPRSQIWEPEQYFTPLFNVMAMYVAWARILATRKVPER